jgi:NDP-sugar pyrophosphorylase family protein
MDPPVAAIILAAGRGTRLRPLTDHWAKPAIPILNRPIIEYALDAVAATGVAHIGVNLWHRGRQVERVVESWLDARVRRGGEIPSLHFSRESRLLGTGGGARRVWERLGRPQGTVIVANGDIVTDVDLRDSLRAHRERGATATLLVQGDGEGGVWIDDEGARVRGLPGRSSPVRLPDAARQVSFCGTSLLEVEALSALPRGPGCLLRDGLTLEMARGARIGAVGSRWRHLDVGTPARYWAATLELLSDVGPSAPAPPAGVRFHPPVALDATVVLAGPCDIGPNVVLGGGVKVAAGAVLSDLVAYGFPRRLEGRQGGWVQIGPARLDRGLLLGLASES